MVLKMFKAITHGTPPDAFMVNQTIEKFSQIMTLENLLSLTAEMLLEKRKTN